MRNRPLLTAMLLALCLAFPAAALSAEAEPERNRPGRAPAEPADGDIIRGGPGDDVIVGSPGADDIRGGTGDDVIRGRGGRDFIEGGPGNDEIFGNNSQDPRR